MAEFLSDSAGSEAWCALRVCSGLGCFDVCTNARNQGNIPLFHGAA